MNLVLPLPPSINAMYRHHGHVTYKTNEAKVWIKECTKLVKVKKTITGNVDISINFYFKRERDIDGGIKASLDLLESTKIIENDKQVYSLSITKDFDKSDPRMEIEIVEND